MLQPPLNFSFYHHNIYIIESSIITYMSDTENINLTQVILGIFVLGTLIIATIGIVGYFIVWIWSPVDNSHFNSLAITDFKIMPTWTGILLNIGVTALILFFISLATFGFVYYAKP